MRWKDALAEKASLAMKNVHELADVSWRRFERRLGLNEPRHIAAYHGYANEQRLWVSGRLLANKPSGSPKDDDNWWDNLQATYNRWESDEIPGAPIRLQYASTVKTVETDAEGYYSASFAVDDEAPRTGVVTAQHVFDRGVLTALHRVTLLDPEASVLIVSDMDDTVIHTGITNLLVAAQLTFLNNAKTRKPLAGVASLYQALARGAGDKPVNPVVYLSNSAWNMYDLLRDFLDLNDLPEGPLLLRDIGAGSDTSNHKIETLCTLIERFDPLPVVLIGDSGQHDAEIYSQVAVSHPERVKAIYIRDIDPGDESEYDMGVDRIVERSAALGVPFRRVQDSVEVARHAVELGLLSRSQQEGIVRDVQVDMERDSLLGEVTEELTEELTEKATGVDVSGANQ